MEYRGGNHIRTAMLQAPISPRRDAPIKERIHTREYEYYMGFNIGEFNEYHEFREILPDDHEEINALKKEVTYQKDRADSYLSELKELQEAFAEVQLSREKLQKQIATLRDMIRGVPIEYWLDAALGVER
jgi:hypothetical protein